MRKILFLSLLFIPITCFSFSVIESISPASAESTINYQEITADVESIQVFAQDAGYGFSFFIPKSDYGTKNFLAMNKSTWVYGDDLNFLHKIIFDYKDSSTFTNERFINVWDKNGAFTLRTTAVSAKAHDFTNVDKITVLEGCTFPQYDYCSSASIVPSYYKTTKTMVFVNDGVGNFSFDKHYGDYELPEGYNCIDTEISSVSERNGNELLSFLEFSLSSSDYGYSFTDLGITYSSKLAELKFLDYIYINGNKASLDIRNGYTLQSILNYGSSGCYAIRTYGNNTGSYYLSNGKVIRFDEDCCAYEIVVAKGCCFPSYSYLKGETSIPTCYVNTQTKRFIWEKGQYVIAEDYNEPNRIENDVVSVSSHGSGSDTAIDFYMEEFDFPTSVSNCVIDSTLNYSSKIALTNRNNEKVSTTGEGFANVWGNKGCFSIRKPLSVSWSDIKAVTIYQGCEFPGYYSYINYDDSRYVTTETKVFYSNGDGTFYLCNEITADEFSASFISALEPICSSADPSSREAQLNVVFSSYASIYNQMSTEEKANINDSGSSTVKVMLEKYDYIVGKYNIEDDFLKRKSEFILFKDTNSNNDLNINDITIIIVISVICLPIFLYVIRRWRKSNEKN